MNVTELFASNELGTVALFAATTLVPLTYTARSAGWVRMTFLVPLAKLTRDPPLDDANTVVRAKELVDAVYVPIPTSHELASTIP